MFRFGGFLFAFGIMSFILNYFDREFVIFLWIGLWGPKTAIAIRIAMIVLGLVLMGIDYPDIEDSQLEGEE